MGRSLTTLALLLAVILGAALIVPAVTDWEEERASLETRLQEIVGGPVELAGPVSVRILPSPRLTAARISLEDADGRLGITGASLHAELALWPLFVNRVVVTQIVLEGGDIHITSDAAATRALADELASRMSIGAGAFNYVIAPEQLILGEGDEAAVFEKSQLEAQWAGSDTPVRVTVRAGDDIRADAVFRPQADGSWRVNLRGGYRDEIGEFSASGVLRRFGAGAPFDGEFSLSVDDTHLLLGLEGEGPALSLRGPFHAAGATWSAPEMRLNLGTMQAAMAMDAEIGAGLSLNSHMTTALADLDSIGIQMAPLRDLAMAAALRGAEIDAPHWLNVDSAFDAEGLVLNNRAARNVNANFSLHGGDLRLLNFNGRFPGGSDIAYAPRRDRARGLTISSASFRSLIGWLGVDVSTFPEDKLQALDLNLAISEETSPLRLSVLSLTLDGGRAEGVLSLDDDGGIVATADFAGLNLDAYAPNAGSSFLSRLRHYGGLAGAYSAAEFNLSGENVHLAGADVARFRFAAVAGEDALEIERMLMNFANGGTLSAQGHWGGEGAALALEIEGSSVDPGLFEGLPLAPNAPADLDLSLARNETGLEVQGNVRTQGLSIDLVGHESPGSAENAIEGRMIARGLEQGALASAMALDTFAGHEGAELLDLQWAGPLESGTMTARLELAGLSVLARGSAANPFSDHPQADLAFEMTARSTADVVAQLGGPDLETLRNMMLAGAGRLQRSESGWRVESDDVLVGEIPVDVALRSTEQMPLAGRVNLERLHLMVAPEEEGEGTLAWSTRQFALDWLESARADLNIGIGTLRLGDVPFKDVGFHLVVGDASISVSDGRGTVGSGLLTGSVNLTRNDTALVVAADVAGQDVPVGAIFASAQLPEARGQMTISSHLQTQGRSPFDLIAGLEGRVDIGLTDSAFTTVDLSHLEQALPDVRTRRALRDAANEAVSMGETPLARLAGTVPVSHGVFTLSGLEGVAETGLFSVGGSFDLRSEIVDVETTFQINDAEFGAAPVIVAFRSAGNGLSTSIDISALQELIGLRLADTPQGLLGAEDLPEDLQELLRSYEEAFPEGESGAETTTP